MISHVATLVAVLAVVIATAVEVPRFNYIDEYSSTSEKPPIRPPSSPPTSWNLKNVPRFADASEEARIAYFVQVSDSSLRLIPRLLARLHHPDNFYALHFDKKIPAYRVIKIVSAIKSRKQYSNVHIMERENVTYRGITMVLNNMAAIKILLDMGEWHYFINLSGSDYPLVSPSAQRKFLAMPYVRESDSNFFTISPQPQWKHNFISRFEHITVDTALGMSEDVQDAELVVLDRRTPLRSKLGYNYVKSEGWLILTRNACKFMLESNYARKMLLSMAFTQDASEHLYVSLLWNHPDYNSTIIPHALRTVYWRLNGVNSGQHPYIINEVKEDDGSYTLWPFLQNSPHWFARKFSEPNSEIMDWIDDEMSGMGNNVNETSVSESLERVEHHLHWLFSILDRDSNRANTTTPEEGIWPSR